MTTTAKVILWGTEIGAVSWLEERRLGVFQYEPDFLASGIQLAPLMMPLGEFPYEFPAIARETFMGLPGMLADSLPDRFGNAVINAWLASEGRDRASFHPVERLCYTGKRGMGALEFEPATLGPSTGTEEIEVAKLVELANQVLTRRSDLRGVFTGEDDRKAIRDILRVGTSAGGARAKAVLAWNPETDEFKSGQMEAEQGLEHWIMKFDGVSGYQDDELTESKGYGKIEYAYHLMAVEAGIHMSACRLHQEGGRCHFMTKRFDRGPGGGKIHMQSLGAIAHFDYKQPAGYSYEQAIQVMKRLELPAEDLEQQVLRAAFNVAARNQDDHVKNIAFLMDRRGRWRLSPAFDVTYAWNPSGIWTSRHQMSINGKRDGIDRSDLVALAGLAGIKKVKANEMVDRVVEAVGRWPQFAAKVEITDEIIAKIRNGHWIEDLSRTVKP